MATMSVPDLATTFSAPVSLDVDVLVVGVLAGEGGPVPAPGSPDLGALASAFRALGVTGAQDEVRRVPAPEGFAAPVLALVGLGDSVTPDAVRYAAGSASRQLAGTRSLGVALPADSDELVLAALEGAALGAYAFTAYRSTPPSNGPVERVVVCADSADESLVARASATAEAVSIVRDLVHMPPNDLYPEEFARRVGELAEGLPLAVEVLDEHALAEGGYGGILGVGRGSVRPPRLVVVRYAPEGAERHLSLVGKGITFDSGGLSLKPAASMVGMKYDMTGAATALAVVLAAARLGIRTRVTARLCLAENMPSGSAMRPNDVITVRGGATVEVLNTDAEGRLVLADGLADASAELPDALVDIATLTGAARVALGNRYTGVMGEEELVRRVVDLATSVGESMWPMPLPGELRAVISSEVADIANARPGNTAAGMLLAAVFLREFVGTGPSGARVPWAHLDIAGPANNDGAPYGWVGKGSTGVAVRTLVALAGELSRP